MTSEKDISRGAELLAPAGDFATALAAFDAGADAVYCGLSAFSARAFATNLSFEELESLVAVARARSRRVYVTFNTVVDDDRLAEAVDTLARLDEIAPDGLIVQDIGVARIARRSFPRLELHASTQLVAHNLEGVLALGELGFRRVVLARELSLAEVASIAKRCGARRIADDGRPEMELETFVHGALCYSLSGLCLFGAMEQGRSGNRGACPYCCRASLAAASRSADAVSFAAGSLRSSRATPPVPDASRVPHAASAVHPFSMKDLRLGDDARRLVEAGVSSLKIEGRMKSALYVASVTRHYRDILDGAPQRVSASDLETVFSRRTTRLYFDGRSADASPVDGSAPGHLGADAGTVKKVTFDREGRAWLRFRTRRALEKHDGLQFDVMDDDGRPVGFGVGEMRQAISRRPVFEVNAGVDVEVLLPDGRRLAEILRPGTAIGCTMSNAVKRMFPAPSFRPSDYPGGCAIDVTVTVSKDGVKAEAQGASGAPGTSRPTTSSLAHPLEPAKSPEKTAAAVEKAFSKLGGTHYRLGKLSVVDPDGLFAPASILNDLRRDLVESLDAERAKARQSKIAAAMADLSADGAASTDVASAATPPMRRVKIRLGQAVPPGRWDETIVAINSSADERGLSPYGGDVRLALPVYVPEADFNRLRSLVKRLLRAGHERWECSDLATLRMLKALGVEDVTADWTLYAFNRAALAAVAGRGVRRVVASPENSRANLRAIAASGRDVEFISQQSTPLFVSLTEPLPYESDSLVTFRRDGLFATTRRTPRTFEAQDGASTRLDLSWDPPS